jgi:MGT family glycosyltransferase
MFTGDPFMKVLIVSAPAIGHLNPLLAITHGLLNDGHDVTILTGSILRSRVEASGAKFRTLSGNADLDSNDLHAIIPELKDIEPGPEWLSLVLQRLFVDTIPAQYEGVQQAVRDIQPDVIVGENMMFGMLPLLLGPRANRPPVVLCGTSVLHAARDDGAPLFIGLAHAATQTERDRYAEIAADYDRVVDAPVNCRLNGVLAKLGVGPLSIPMFYSGSTFADAFLQLTVPSFEFPRAKLPPAVRFVGRPPIVPNQAPVPPWADELDGSRKVVLVTQGTVANHDFGLLVAPTLAALADEKDLLVVVTTGGRAVDTIPGTIPANARVASYLPFEWMLEKVDVLVTNGGYGSVNQALSFGVPIVAAGQTEDKPDVNARIAWSGAGIDLATNQPSPQAVREAVRALLDQPSARAKAIAAEFAEIDTRAEIVRIINEVVNGQTMPRVRAGMAAG